MPNPEPTTSVVYRLSNLSDAVTFEAPSLEVAACASFILGEGQYGSFPQDRERYPEVPIFIMGGGAEWYEETFGREYGDGLEALGEAISSALDSVWYADFVNRPLLSFALQAIDDANERAAYLAKWNDDRRSSMNDIGARAATYAKALREPRS